MDPRFAVLLTCFFLSGFAGLLYETVWTRQFAFAFGTSELALVAVLGSYMAGLALGSALSARAAARVRRPALAYALLEGGIAACALLVPSAIRGIQALTVALHGGEPGLVESSGALVAQQAIGSFVVLLVPTALMGATLPLLAQGVVSDPGQLGPRISRLYAANTLGAVAGTLCAAFALIPALGLSATVWVGAGLNVLVLAIAARLGLRVSSAQPPAASAARARSLRSALVPLLMFASGATSFVYEVLWVRMLSPILGGSLYAFATMLASFLLGIALGSAAAARWSREPRAAAAALAWSQLGAGAFALGAFAALGPLAARSGFAPVLELGLAAQVQLAAAILLPGALFLGASFPLAVRVLAGDTERAGAASGAGYAWNTLGCIAGAVLAGFWLIPGLGFAGTVRSAAAVNFALAALCALALAPTRLRVAALAGGAGVLLCALAPLRGLELAPIRASLGAGLTPSQLPVEPIFSAVGRSSTVVVERNYLGFRVSTNGLPEAVVPDREVLLPDTGPMWMALLPQLARPEARELLVVGLGGGITLEWIPQRVAAIDVVELEAQVVEANRAIAGLRARDPLADPRVRVVVNDARGALALTDKQYDAIISQPSHPWTAGASHLFTREYYAEVARHLRADGVLVQWIDLPLIDAPLLGSTLASLLAVFPHVRAYRPPPRLQLLLVASREPFDFASSVPAALAQGDPTFARLGIETLEDVEARLALDEDGARRLGADATPISDDRNLFATRAARIYPNGLWPPAADQALAPYAPALGDVELGALARRLAADRNFARIAELAEGRSAAASALLRGTASLGRGEPLRALGELASALALPSASPIGAQARALALSARALGAERPGELERLDAGASAHADAVVRGLRLARAGERARLQELESALAAVPSTDPLAPDALRLRIAWRRGDASQGKELRELTRALALRTWRSSDLLEIAEIERELGSPGNCVTMLMELAARLGDEPTRAPLARRALELLSQLETQDAQLSELRLSLTMAYTRMAQSMGSL